MVKIIRGNAMANTNDRNKRHIILASASPRRQKILKQAGLKFKVIKSNLNEEIIIRKLKNLDYKSLVKVLALSKAVSVLEKADLQKNAVVASFDTMVIFKGKIIGKPKNNKDALKKLSFLSNSTHLVITGFAVIDLKKKLIFNDFEITKVRMKKLKKDEIIKYIKTGEPAGKAGAYAIQGQGRKFVKSISGDYLNVVGLPLNKFLLIIDHIA